MIEILILSVLGFLFTFLITPYVGKYMKKIGKVGNDVHKIDKPIIPESGGIGFMFVYILLIFIGIFIAPTPLAKYRLMIILIILILVTILGLYDDFKRLSAIKKPLLLTILAMPVYLLREVNGYQLANPTPSIPFVGETSLKIVYWGLALFVVAIPSNASNMLDVMNGVMSGSGILIAITAFLTSFIIPLSEESQFITRYASLTLAGVLFAFWVFNKYPAKIFAGDTGSLGVGAAIGLIAIYGEIEFVLVIALLVHIMNSFSIIGSIKGLKERGEIKKRPVTVTDGIISASKDEKAPITLVRLIVADSPKTEDEVVKIILSLVLFSCILALFTAYLIRVSLL